MDTSSTAQLCVLKKLRRLRLLNMTTTFRQHLYPWLGRSYPLSSSAVARTPRDNSKTLLERAISINLLSTPFLKSFDWFMVPNMKAICGKVNRKQCWEYPLSYFRDAKNVGAQNGGKFGISDVAVPETWAVSNPWLQENVHNSLFQCCMYEAKTTRPTVLSSACFFFATLRKLLSMVFRALSRISSDLSTNTTLSFEAAVT